MINKQRLIRLTQELIRIDSQNPPGNEEKICGFVEKYLKRLGLKVEVYAFKKGRPNILACLKGANAGHTLLITPHLDTVPSGKNWNLDPFGALIRKGKIYGLGATDCKCNLAVSLEVINSLVEEKQILDYNLLLAATSDEECGSDLGLIPLLKKGILKPDAALVLDADDFVVVVAQKGLLHIKVKISGKKAHGAYPWRGINAIDIALEILRDLKARKFQYKKNKYLRPPTMNIGTIRGGDKVNVVSDWCEFELDFRFLPGTRAEDLIGRLKRIIVKHAKKFKIEIEGIQNHYQIDPRHPLVKGFVSALEDFKIKPQISGSEGATTITFFQDQGIPAIASGFGSEGCAHAIDEYVKIGNLHKGALVLERFLKNYHPARS